MAAGAQALDLPLEVLERWIRRWRCSTAGPRRERAPRREEGDPTPARPTCELLGVSAVADHRALRGGREKRRERETPAAERENEPERERGEKP